MPDSTQDLDVSSAPASSPLTVAPTATPAPLVVKPPEALLLAEENSWQILKLLLKNFSHPLARLLNVGFLLLFFIFYASKNSKQSQEIGLSNGPLSALIVMFRVALAINQVLIVNKNDKLFVGKVYWAGYRLTTYCAIGLVVLGMLYCYVIVPRVYEDEELVKAIQDYGKFAVPSLFPLAWGHLEDQMVVGFDDSKAILIRLRWLS